MEIDAATASSRFDRLLTRLSTALLVVLVLGGVAVRFAHWAHGHSLWVDELRIANNVVERSLPRLLGEPMLYVSRVPAGHLAIERAIVRAIGPDERALRLPGLIGSLAGLLAAPWLARRLLGAAAAPLPVAMLAFGAPLVAFAADIRPYAWDAAAAVLAPWLALRWLERPERGRTALLAAALLVLPWLSFGAGLASVGVALALLPVAGFGPARAPAGRLAAVASAGVAGFAGAAGLAWWPGRADASGLGALDGFWTAAGGFPPPDAGVLALVAWCADRVAGVSEFAFRPVTAGWPDLVVLLLVASGAVALARTIGWRLAIVVAPLLASLGAGLLRGFPAANRLALAAAPAAVLLAAAPLAALGRGSRARRVAAAVLAVALAAPWLIVAPGLASMPALQSGRELVAEVAKQIRTGDRLYVFYAAEPAFRFYAPRFGLDSGRAVVGDCETWSEGIESAAWLDAPPGTSLWLLYSNAFPEERDWLDRRVATRATPIRRIDRGAGPRRVESLDLHRFGESDVAFADPAAPALPASRWRCAFFESGRAAGSEGG